MRVIDAEYDEFKYIKPMYLVDTMCLFHTCLEKYSLSAKLVLDELELKNKQTVEVKVAVAFAFASASASRAKIYDVEVLRIMQEWLYVSSDKILEQIGKKDFIMPAIGDGGAAK